MVGCWHGCLSGARCRLAYGPADATATHSAIASVKSRLVLPFWYRLTRVVPDKGPLCVCVCVCVVCCITPMNIPFLCMLQAMVVVRVEDMEVVLGKISLVLLHYHMFRL